MINKRLFIGVGIALVIVIFGVLIFLYLRDPELFTKTPMEIISGRVGDNIKIDAPVDTPSIIGDNAETDKLKTAPTTTNFIVSNEHWQNAFILRKYDGTNVPHGVMFVEIPTGTKLYAPVGGYVWVVSVGWNGQEATKLIISSHKEGDITPDKSYFFFMANHFDISLSALDGRRIEQGQEFAQIKKSEELFPGSPGFFDRRGIILAVGFIGNWEIDETIEDPREFIQTAIEKLN